MARYYFDVQAGGEHHLDKMGSDLKDLNAARLQAARTITKLASDNVGASEGSYYASVTVRLHGEVVIKSYLAFDSRTIAAPTPIGTV